MRHKINDVSLNYEVTGTGEPLLLIHGLGSDLTNWADDVPVYAQRYRVVTCDLRGFGQSDKPPGPYSTELFADDLYHLLKHLEIERAFVLGTSMGGVIAQQFTLDHPEIVKALILNSTASECNDRYAQYYEEQAQKVETQGMAGIIDDYQNNRFSKDIQARYPNYIKEFRERFLKNDPQAYASACRAMKALNQKPLTPRLKNITCPTLMMATDEKGRAHGAEATVIMNRNILGSELKLFKDISQPTLEDLEGYHRTVLDFLAKTRIVTESRV